MVYIAQFVISCSSTFAFLFPLHAAETLEFLPFRDVRVA